MAGRAPYRLTRSTSSTAWSPRSTLTGGQSRQCSAGPLRASVAVPGHPADRERDRGGQLDQVAVGSAYPAGADRPGGQQRLADLLEVVFVEVQVLVRRPGPPAALGPDRRAVGLGRSRAGHAVLGEV